MTVVNCPMCELRFATRNERDWHLRNEHEHLHVHPPTDRPVDWPHHGTPPSAESHAHSPAESHVDTRRRSAEPDDAKDETPVD